jgi:hypothetical protein
MMDVEESLQRFGLHPASDVLEEIRLLLIEETARESRQQGDGDTELMKLCCVQLFAAGQLEDIRLIYLAKAASMDAAAAIDVQLLCGAGLPETKRYLAHQHDDVGRAALAQIVESERAGDFTDFSVGTQMDAYRDYYSEDED